MIYLDVRRRSPIFWQRIAIRRTRCGMSLLFRAGYSNAKSGTGSMRVGFKIRTAMPSAA